MNQQYKVMVFRPSLEDMKDFSKYIAYMEEKGAHKAGLAKIIPPPEWCPRKAGYADVMNSKFKIKDPIEQRFNGSGGKYVACNIERRTYSVAEFREIAGSDKYRRPENLFDFNDVERKYWRTLTFMPPVYGADVEGSLYDEDCKEFNIAKLGTCLDLIYNAYEAQIKGVNTPYLYFGMYKATFVWHTEDMDLYSINYLHFGDPKTWYAVPPEHGFRFERMMKGYFPDSYKACSAFLRHKTYLVSTQVLRDNSIPYNRITQEAGEFMITFPFSYHAGFNHGFNCAESTNFALPRWVEYGKRAQRCKCSIDAVKIDMDAFIQKYQPDRYQLWLDGKDFGCHPENPGHIFAAPGPNYDETVKTTKSKRQAPATKRKKNETECDDLGSTVPAESKPLKRGRGRPRTKVAQPVDLHENCSDDNSTAAIDNKPDNKDCEEAEASQLTAEPATSRTPICSPAKQSPGLINRSPQIISFASCSALDRLSEDTKLNVSIQLSSELAAGQSCSTKAASFSNDQSGQFECFTLPFKTKAARKLYENMPLHIPKPENAKTDGDLQVDTISSHDKPSDDSSKRPPNSTDNEAKRSKKEPDLKMCFPNLTSNQNSTPIHSGSNQSPQKSFAVQFYNSTSQQPVFDVRCQKSQSASSSHSSNTSTN